MSTTDADQIYYAESDGLSRDILIHHEGRTVDCITADGESLDAKDEALSRNGYGRQGHWSCTAKLPTSRFLAAVERS